MAYKGLKSSVRKPKSTAAKAAASRNKRSSSYQGLKSTSARRPRTPSKTRSIKVMPLKPNALVEQPPETALSRKGVPLKKLLRTTPKLMKFNAEEVQVKGYKKTKTKSGLPAISAKCIHRDPFMPNKTPKERETYIIGLEDQKKPISRQRKVMVSCSCIAGDSRVLTSKGWKRVYEIAGEYDGETHPITYIVDGEKRQGSVPFFTGKKTTWTLRLQNGESVSATGDHRFLVKPVRGEPEWRELKDIGVGDNLVLSANVGSDLPEKTEVFEQMRFLGFMQGDGTVTKDSKTMWLKVYNDDKQFYVDKFVDLGIVDDITAVTGRDADNICFNHKAKEIVYRYDYSNTHHVPKLFSKEAFFGYLSGLLGADGSVSSKDGKILSVLLRGSDFYLRPVFDRLIRLGYTDTTLRLERTSGTTVTSASMSLLSKQDLYCLKISAKTFYRLYEYLDLSPRFSEYEFKDFRDHTALTKVMFKHYSSRKNVYDIHVPEGNRFIMQGGVVAHNCENYAFMWEYANTLHGASRIMYGNGEPANLTNPANVPGMCKHLTALAYKLIEKGH